MSKVTLVFEKAGLLTTVQDLGRNGYQQFGVPVGGAMDKQSAKSANWLVGNPENGPLLEITFMGPQISFDGDCQIAITGANISPMLDGVAIEMYKTITVVSGSVLRFGRLVSGCRAYMAIGGTWTLDAWLDSYSAAAFDGKDVTPSSVIDQYSTLVVEERQPITTREILEVPRYGNRVNVRLFRGPEFSEFTPAETEQFIRREYQLTPQSNRMGYRLTPSLDEMKEREEMISSGIIPGTIQITNGGQPIILMADAQTTGGYPRIANVVSDDMDLLAQLKPGDVLTFTLVA